MFIADGHDEFSVYAFPFNRDWEISYSEFTDSHDGLYLGGVEDMKFHELLMSFLKQVVLKRKKLEELIDLLLENFRFQFFQVKIK